MVSPPTQPLVLTLEDARRIVDKQASHVAASGHETVDLLHAAGRVLAESVTADRDIPPFHRSTRDGYAVHTSDQSKLPAKLKVIGEIKAGPLQLPSPLHRGEAFSIMTGAPVPQGADAVVMVEYTSLQADSVEITRGVAPGENIVPQGAEAKRGSLLLDRGTRLDESAIALAASVGRSRLQVFVRPRVAVLTTGDEIVEIDTDPGPTQIRNSNTYSLAVQIQQAGGEPVLLPIAPDELGRLRQLIEEGLESDLLIMTGGVSMGRYDLVEQVLADLQAEFFFTGAKIQPGRPVVFGRVKCGAGAPASGASAPVLKYFFGLPGNPVSTMVTFELFARPMLEALAGMFPRPLAYLHARLKSEIRVKAGLTRFLPATLSGKYEDSQAELVPWQGSGDIAARARANCYIVIPPDREHILSGEWVAVMLL
ncbi:MAG TPA: gephyrin-like molybdotransferase Glp [Candidatus Acidoferrum sp.]|jgi:molybdopterin molybdotransferase|nr:gephyrin-like molybdotransferase Glp [Candidatus Acidoferrum sp.]